MIGDARWDLNSGGYYPFDAPDAWWDQAGSLDCDAPPDPVDWAHAAARGVAHYIGRRDFTQGHDDRGRHLFVSELADIIRLAAADGQREAAAGGVIP